MKKLSVTNGTRAILAVTAAALAVSLFGCGKGGDDPTLTAAPVSVATKPQPTPPTNKHLVFKKIDGPSGMPKAGGGAPMVAPK